MINPYLFVYGTLQSGYNNPMAQFLREHSTYMGKGRIPGKMIDLGHYPGAVFDPNATAFVYGEIYRLNAPEAVFNMLDEYEGIGPQFPHPHEYKRVECPVFFEKKVLNCWMYAYNLEITDS